MNPVADREADEVGQVAAAGAALVAVATFVIPWAMRAVWSGGGPGSAAGVAAPVSSSQAATSPGVVLACTINRASENARSDPELNAFITAHADR